MKVKTIFLIVSLTIFVKFQSANAQVPVAVVEALAELVQLIAEKANNNQLQGKIQGAINNSDLISALESGQRVLIEFPIRKDPSGFKYLDHPKIHGVGKDDVVILCKSLLHPSINPGSRYPNLIEDIESTFLGSYERLGNSFVEQKTLYPFTTSLYSKAKNLMESGSCE